jgi:hypothetical protein
MSFNNPMTDRRQLNEKLDWIMEIDDLQEQQKRAKLTAQKDNTFLTFMRMAFLKSNKITGIPDGMPDTYKPEPDVPDGTSDTIAVKEIRRIANFLPNGSVQSLNPAQREMQWIRLMEGLHWKEAKVIIAIKDQVLEELYPNITALMKSLGMPVDVVVPEKPKNSKSATPVPKKKRPRKVENAS